MSAAFAALAIGMGGCAPVRALPTARTALPRGGSPSAAAPSPPQAWVPKAEITPRLTSECVTPPHAFTCVMRRRIREVERYLARRPGQIGLVLHDRETGATWGDADADVDFPAASTVKLAMITDLLLRSRAGQITLTGYDWSLMDQALRESSDTAADDLWFSYEDGSFLNRIRRFGMRTASFSASPPYWGFMYCSPRDLDRLMNYVLADLPTSDRSYIVGRLRHVAPIQQWGVWSAGRRPRSGSKDGWEDDKGVWIVDTVGFAGPDARYTLAIMDDLGGAADFHEGSTTLSEISDLLFRGHFGPVPTAEATP